MATVAGIDLTNPDRACPRAPHRSRVRTCNGDALACRNPGHDRVSGRRLEATSPQPPQIALRCSISVSASPRPLRRRSRCSRCATRRCRSLVIGLTAVLIRGLRPRIGAPSLPHCSRWPLHSAPSPENGTPRACSSRGSVGPQTVADRGSAHRRDGQVHGAGGLIDNDADGGRFCAHSGP